MDTSNTSHITYAVVRLPEHLDDGLFHITCSSPNWKNIQYTVFGFENKADATPAKKYLIKQIGELLDAIKAGTIQQHFIFGRDGRLHYSPDPEQPETTVPAFTSYEAALMDQRAAIASNINLTLAAS
jgi:hypothetical protein